MSQPSLLDTRRAARESIEDALPKLRAKVLAEIRTWRDYGCTDEQIQDQLGMNPSTERPRRRELVQAGLIVDSGQRRVTRSGRKAIVWVAK